MRWFTACGQEVNAILRAMSQVASGGGRHPLTEAAQRSVASAAHTLFNRPEEAAGTWRMPISPSELREQVCSPELAEWTTRFLAVMALVDGRIDRDKIGVVLDYASALRIECGYVTQLAEAERGNLDWVLTDMTRQNIMSLLNETWEGRDVMTVLLPYRGECADPALAARYRGLGGLAPGTFGRAVWDLYIRNGYAFPGEEAGVNERFGIPHDSTHVLSGYDTSPQGEILVSTFTAGMHPRLPMEGHILPVLFSWHLGIEINAFAKSARGQLDPEKFWVAWRRGSTMTGDLFDPQWNFWSMAGEPVNGVREHYGVPPLRPRHAAGVLSTLRS